MMDIAILGFTLAGACAVYRLLVGPTLVDRIVALDVMLISLMGAITVHAAATQDTNNLITLVVISIIGFTATTAASRFVQTQAGGEQ